MNFRDYCTSYPKHAFDADEVILREGSKTGLLYVLLEGAVEIEKQGVVLTRVCEPGAIFGEISALLNTPHTATVKALTSCRFYLIEDAEQFMRSHSDVGVLLAKVLAQRVTSITAHLATVSQSLNTLMKRETAARKAREEKHFEKPVARVIPVGALERASVGVR